MLTRDPPPAGLVFENRTSPDLTAIPPQSRHHGTLFLDVSPPPGSFSRSLSAWVGHLLSSPHPSTQHGALNTGGATKVGQLCIGCSQIALVLANARGMLSNMSRRQAWLAVGTRPRKASLPRCCRWSGAPFLASALSTPPAHVSAGMLTLRRKERRVWCPGSQGPCGGLGLWRM